MSMVSNPPAALASITACRSEPAPESLRFETVKVAARAGDPRAAARSASIRN
jgi:hypothetical protein